MLSLIAFIAGIAIGWLFGYGSKVHDIDAMDESDGNLRQ